MIEYQRDAKGIEPSDLDGFFAGWPNPPAPDTHLRILNGSDVTVLAIDGRRVVGFVTALTDGILSAYIPLLEVLPSHRGRGIGECLMHRVLDRLQGIYVVDICCDESLVPFYGRFQLQRGVAMSRRDYSAQSGSPSSGTSARRLALLGGTEPAPPEIPRRRVDPRPAS